jgi:hypothetical protein
LLLLFSSHCSTVAIAITMTVLAGATAGITAAGTTAAGVTAANSTLLLLLLQ